MMAISRIAYDFLLVFCCIYVLTRTTSKLLPLADDINEID